MVALPPQTKQRVEELPQLYQLALRYPPRFEETKNADQNLIDYRGDSQNSTHKTSDTVAFVVRKSREKFFAPPTPAPQHKGLLEKLKPHKSKTFATGKNTVSAVEITPDDTDPTNLTHLMESVLDEESLALTPAQIRQAEQLLNAELTGLGPLQPLTEIKGITDIFVNSPADVWIEASGQLQRTAVTFKDEAEVRALATRLITAAGARLDDSRPSADVHTATGYRVHAVLPPLSSGSTLLSIRIQPENRMTLEELESRGFFTAEIGELLRYLVHSRKNFLISGGTGTGKTTLLNALLSTCSAGERIITVEDSAELAPLHPHTLSLRSRTANTEGQGEITLTELIRQALRMRPSRLVLGECRGAEVADMLTAMNTGHSGTGATLHANSTGAIPARLYALGALAGMSQQATALQASTAIDYLIHIERQEGRRFIAEISRLLLAGGQLSVQPLCFYQQARRRQMLTFSEAGQKLLEEARGARA